MPGEAMPNEEHLGLEIAKIVVSALTPLTIACLGVFIHRLTKKYELIQWKNQKLIEKRLAVYEDLAPLLNDNLCYFTYVGCWKEKTPKDIINAKRIIDKKIYISAPLFSPAFFEACMKMQHLCYETFNGWGQDARLRTRFSRRKEHSAVEWNAEWDLLFSENPIDSESVRKAYQKIMEIFSEEIGINTTPAPKKETGRKRVLLEFPEKRVGKVKEDA